VKLLLKQFATKNINKVTLKRVKLDWDQRERVEL
jgi:hypothetical protein